jgi:dihydrofolate synthase / folylpolyglutamate synthase
VRLKELSSELYARVGRGAELGLERMRAALALLGDPQRHLAAVHVAGTNGKGSTAAMLEAIGRAAGLRTGLYSSPHLVRLNERIRIDGAPIDDDGLERALERALDPRLPQATFFEAMTLCGFFAMREAGVELAVIEVGLGGRLDATNVLEAPLATAITSIGLDHVELLGEGLASIACEKAAIARAGVPLVVGPVETEALAAIEGATRTARPRWLLGSAAGFDPVTVLAEGSGIEVSTPRGRFACPTVALEGAHQRDNAAIAVCLAALAGDRLPPLTDPEAMARGIATARWPGRIERLRSAGVEVILDCAHNPHAVRALGATLAGLDPRRTSLVFGTMADKPWREMIADLAPLAEQRHYCAPPVAVTGRRAADPAALAATCPGRAHESVGAALDAALAEAQEGGCVLVTGSIFLVGAARAHLLGMTSDPLVPL